AAMLGIPVSRAAKRRIHVLQRSLPREPDERKTVAGVESRIRERHPAVEEEPGDVVDQLPECRRLATADADDVQLDAAHPVQTVSVQPRLAARRAVAEDGVNAEQARRSGRDARGGHSRSPVAGPRMKTVDVDPRDRPWG